jgi:serine/threonine-protein kinase
VSNKAEQPTVPGGPAPRRSDPASGPLASGSQPASDFDLGLAVGDRIGGRYIVKEFLGKGGMGAVYRALDEELDEEVALKLVRGRGDDELLRDEVRLAQKVTHENVCRTYDLEDAGEQLFVKMEYIIGETVAARLKRGRIAIADVVKIARGIAAGLAAAHGKGIVHRDLKPGNVMLAGDGRTVLMDFGLARRVAAGADDLAGTPGYMAPEQIIGTPVDERTDYYALGCVIYEMLIGERVFGTGTSSQTADHHVGTPPPDPRELRPDVPRWLARATLALLAKDPEVRRGGLALIVRGPRRRRLAIPAIVVVGVAVAALVVATRHPRWEPRVVDVVPAAEESSDGASISPDGKTLAFNSDRDDTGVFRLYLMPIAGGDAKPITRPGESYDEPRWTRDGAALLTASGWDHMVRLPIDGSPATELGRGNSPDDCGDAIAFVETSWNGFALMLRLADGTRKQLVRAFADEVIEKPRCDPSGEHVVFVRGMTQASAFGNDVYIVDRAGRVTAVTTDHAAGAATFAGDDVVYSARRAGKVQLYEAAGVETRRITFDDGPDGSPDVSRDGQTLAFMREVNLFSIVGGYRGAVHKVTSLRETVYNLRVASATGDVLVGERAEGGGDTIVVIDAATGAERALVRGYFPFVSLDGKTVYFRAPDAPGRLQRIALAGGNASTVAELPGRIVVGFDALDGQHVELDRDHHLASWRVAPDGAVSSDGVDGVVVPAPLGGYRYVETPDDDHFTLRIVPPGQPLSAGRELAATSSVNTWLDDHRLAYADDDAFHVVDVTTGDELATVAAPGHGGVLAVMARDGEHWFDSKSVSRVTRHVIANFGER